MKYIVLIITFIYLIATIIGSFKVQTQKEYLDNSMKGKAESKEDKKLYAAIMAILTVIPILYLILTMIFINSFWFSIVACLYLFWTLYDTNDTINYISEGKVSKALNSRLYKILSKPFDLAFCIYLLYQLFIKW